jgi:hypothetical protein
MLIFPNYSKRSRTHRSMNYDEVSDYSWEASVVLLQNPFLDRILHGKICPLTFFYKMVLPPTPRFSLGEGFGFRVTIPGDSSNRNCVFHCIFSICAGCYLALLKPLSGGPRGILALQKSRFSFITSSLRTRSDASAQLIVRRAH